MTALAPWVAAMALAALAAGALLLERRRDRAAAMALAALLAPILIAADNWDTVALPELRSSPAALAASLLVLLAFVAALAAAFVHRPAAFALIAVAVLPFRVPVELGGKSANLLVPLYVVIAAGIAASAYRALASRRRSEGVVAAPAPGSDAHPAVRLVRLALAASIVLYAAQAAYTDDLSAALKVLCFFLVPFALLFALLLESRWTPTLLRGVFAIVVVEALVFATVGFWQYGTRELFWNDKVIAGNEVHSWFRVNSLFWDPNILGRYLAVTVIALAAAVAWARRPLAALVPFGLAVVLLLALGLTFSQSSLTALVVGLVTLVALRWSVRWTLLSAAALAAAALLIVLAGAAGTDFGSDTLEAETSGRASLVSGGFELAGDRPLAGFGSGSFETEFAERFGAGPGVSVASHTEPITVAAEQGAVGLVVYVALIGGALWALLAGIGALAPGLGATARPFRGGLAVASWPAAGPWTLASVRVALFAGFVAMMVHSLGYGAFLSDPITWVLLAAGLTLARERAFAPSPASGRRRSAPEATPVGVS